MRLVLLVAAIVALTGAPASAHAQGDPADSLYRVARRALSDKEYSTAARTFDAIVTRYPRSSYAPDALYWKGFALNRAGDLDGAQGALEAQESRYPRAATRSDAAALLILVKAQLAQRGSSEARRDVDRAAASSGRGCQDMELQAAALDAVQQMDAERALPLLRRVVARRDDCSIPLRKNAVFIIAQHAGTDRERILLDVARNDPSTAVRKDAVFHLSSARSDLAVDALEQLLRGSDPAVRSDALFSLAQMHTDRATKSVRDFALSATAPPNLRRDAFFHLAQNATDEDLAWLRQAYGRVDDVKLRADVLFHIASKPSPETSRWLLGVVTDEREAMENRKNAIFHLAQHKDDAALDALIAIAKRGPNVALRKDALFHLGQSKDVRAVKALEEIVAP
ncbi:MAG TPA: HEAT repeat domain-containing protein [Gemmatimonadaceae bacterium]|nr:HEAT repeat domain-containing protein [Gemmatimonadaceae bacterium]